MTEKSITLHSHRLQPITLQLARAQPSLLIRCPPRAVDNILSPLSVWLCVFISPSPTNTPISSSSVSPSCVSPLWSHSQANDLLTASSWKWALVPDRDRKGTESVKIHYGLTRLRTLPPLRSPSLKVGRVGQGQVRGGKRKWQTGKTILPFVELVVCEGFWGGGKVAFPCAHAERLGGLRSKLSPCWKITALHDRSTSLSTLLFTFLPQPGSSFTLSCKPANAI